MSKHKKPELTEYQENTCKKIIHAASVAAGSVGTGLAQIPLADNALITPIQIGMVVALGKVFNQKITESAAQALLGSFTAQFVGRSISQLAFGWIPLWGNAINTATAAGLTEAVGWLAVAHFAENLATGDGEEAETSEAESSLPGELAETETGQLPVLTHKEELLAQAEMFFSGEKSFETDAEEYNQLLNAFEREKLSDPDDPQIKDAYDKLMDLGFN